MERVCPECNKLSTIDIKCEYCNNKMTDCGRAQEIYQDDYSANMPINDNIDYCVHVFKCRYCGNLSNVKISKINM